MNRTWIFQGNPDEFDIVGCLNAGFDRITWLTTRYADKMQQGDRVFIWQAAGSHNAVSGILAEGTIDSSPGRSVEQDGTERFQVNPSEASTIETRVWLKIVKIAKIKEIIKREWLLQDPVCHDLLILRQPNGTNYPVEAAQEQRLSRLWERTGQDWDWGECVAAMLTYEDLRGHPISELPDSPVANLALLIGRAVSSAYSKVLNFRAIDPRDMREGRDSVSEEDRRVWKTFFDQATQQVRYGALMAEFDRLWKDSFPGNPAADAEAIVGTDYRQADENAVPALAQPGVPDPDTVGRGLQGHARTQNQAADFLISKGLRPLSPRPEEPRFDFAWKQGDELFVAEVKSITASNAEKQLRLGLGQVLRYRHFLGRKGQTVRAVLVTEVAPPDRSWLDLCRSLDVLVAWPGAFAERLP